MQTTRPELVIVNLDLFDNAKVIEEVCDFLVDLRLLMAGK